MSYTEETPEEERLPEYTLVKVLTRTENHTSLLYHHQGGRTFG